MLRDPSRDRAPGPVPSVQREAERRGEPARVGHGDRGAGVGDGAGGVDRRDRLVEGQAQGTVAVRRERDAAVAERQVRRTGGAVPREAAGELGEQDTFMNELFTGSPAVQLDGDQLTLTSTRIVFTAPKA